MAIITGLINRAVGVARLVFQVIAAPTSFLLRLLFRNGRKQITQVVYNLAASRAAESAREDALFVDPLAEHFIEGVVTERRPRRPSNEERQTASSSKNIHRRTVSYTIARTKYFDDALLVILGDEQHGDNAMFDDLREIVQEMESTCQQVVMLGSGFDARPWRLPLNATRWFEVDRPIVIQEKQKQLQKCDAAVTFKEEHAHQYGLKCLSLAMVPTSVCRANWIQSLSVAGLKPSVATVWMLEGLLAHLDPHHVERILQQLHDVSLLGSFLITSIIYESQISSSSTAQRSNRQTRKWGCPEDAEEYFARFGWNVLTILPWTTVAKMYGCKPRTRSSATEHAQFLIAIKA